MYLTPENETAIVQAAHRAHAVTPSVHRLYPTPDAYARAALEAAKALPVPWLPAGGFAELTHHVPDDFMPVLVALQTQAVTPSGVPIIYS